MMDTLTVTSVSVPTDLTTPDASDFHALADVLTRALVFDLGRDHLDWVAAEMLPGWQNQTDHVRGGFLARRDGVVAGALCFAGPQEPGARELEFDLLAAPDHRGQGVESALLARLIDTARTLGRSVLQTYSLHRVTPGADMMTPPTGFGRIPRDEQTLFYLDRGFTLEQVDRNSLFDLTADLGAVAHRLGAAERFAGDEYRTVVWTSPTPPEHVDGFAFVLSRMATDVPLSGLTVTEEIWDGDRVRRRDDRQAASGLLASVAAIMNNNIQNDKDRSHKQQ